MPRRRDELDELIRDLERECASDDLACALRRARAVVRLSRRLGRMLHQLAFAWHTMPPLRGQVEGVVARLRELGVVGEEEWERALDNTRRYIANVIEPEAQAVNRLIRSKAVRDAISDMLYELREYYRRLNERRDA